MHSELASETLVQIQVVEPKIQKLLTVQVWMEIAAFAKSICVTASALIGHWQDTVSGTVDVTPRWVAGWVSKWLLQRGLFKCNKGMIAGEAMFSSLFFFFLVSEKNASYKCSLLIP